MSDQRLQQALLWLRQQWHEQAYLQPLAADASFRRYFRAHLGDQTRVLMDAPPSNEAIQPFLDVCASFRQRVVHVPEVYAFDVAQGFVLLQDFGDQTWSKALLSGAEPGFLMADAWRQLHALQAQPAESAWPCFDMQRMHAEVDLYLDWYLPYVAKKHCTSAQKQTFHRQIQPLLQQLDKLPKVAVHLDYHSRNLMLPSTGLPLGVIDFQDAVAGPVCYDVASLLYDCYQSYAELDRRAWSLQFYQSMPVSLSGFFDGFEHWHVLLRLMALQRHLKAMGIFARLAYRDGKSSFLDELPLTRQHLLDELPILQAYMPQELRHFLQHH